MSGPIFFSGLFELKAHKLVIVLRHQSALYDPRSMNVPPGKSSLLYNRQCIARSTRKLSSFCARLGLTIFLMDLKEKKKKTVVDVDKIARSAQVRRGFLRAAVYGRSHKSCAAGRVFSFFPLFTVMYFSLAFYSNHFR